MKLRSLGAVLRHGLRRAALCKTSLKHRFSLPSDVLELLFELSQFIRRCIREDFLYRRNVLLNCSTNFGLYVGGFLSIRGGVHEKWKNRRQRAESLVGKV